MEGRPVYAEVQKIPAEGFDGDSITVTREPSANGVDGWDSLAPINDLKAPRNPSASLAAICAFLLAVYPPIQGALLGGVASIVTFLAADAFYYLSIAVNSSAGHYTFDGISSTNGFHPLWGVALQFAVEHLAGKHGFTPLVISFALSVLAAAIGLALMAASIVRMSGVFWSALLLFPGGYFFLVALVDPRFGSVWSFMNGMESPFSILFFGCLLLLLTSRRSFEKPAHILLLSLTSIALLLARLDDVFLLLSIGLWLLFGDRRHGGWRRAISRVALYAAPIAFALALYLYWNWKAVGVLLPTSGMAKGNGSAIVKNLGGLILVCCPFATRLSHGFASRLSGPILGLSLSWRFIQMLLPIALAGFLLLRRRFLEWIAQKYASSFSMLLAYVVIKGVYNLLFVPIWYQGHWYYALSIMIIDCTIALGVVRLVKLISHLYEWRPRALPLLACSIAWLAALGVIWRAQTQAYQNTASTQTLYRGEFIRSQLAMRDPGFRIIEFDDGILNYALSSPTMSGFGLASDASSLSALKQGRLLSYARLKGFNLIGSVNYSLIDEGDMTSGELEHKLAHWALLPGEKDLGQFHYSVAYIDPVTKAYFIRFDPR